MSLRIEVIPAAQLSAEDRRQVIDLCSEVFELDYAPFIAEFSNATHVVGYEANEVVSHALWLRRTLRVGTGQVCNAGYVEAVATRPERQRLGYGSAVMRRLHEYLTEYDFGALSTGRIEWYESLGWQQWLGPRYIRRGSEIIATPDDRVMIYAVPGKPVPDVTVSLTADWRPLELW